MALKFREKTVRVVEYEDLDAFIGQELPNLSEPFECVPVEEWNNDSYYNMSIDGDIEEYNQKTIENILATGEVGSYTTRLILNYLCQQGKLEAGEYLIHVFW